jgi:hypothetical protein
VYDVIGPPFVSGSDQVIVTKSLLQVVVGASGLEGLEAAKTDIISENSPYP